MKSIAIILLLSCLSLLAQSPMTTGSGIDWTRASAVRWLPTTPANTFALWAELTPTNGTYGGSTGTTIPANDNQDIKYWTNLSSFIANSRWTADQTLHPTNFVSGGGGIGTSPRVFFTAASSTRLVGPTIPDLTNKFTVILVADCSSSSGIDYVIFDGVTGTSWINYNAHKLEMSQGTTVSSAATMGTGTYVISVVFAAGASSHIDTNGVQMVAGNAGSANLRAPYLAHFNTICYHGNIYRVWGWYGVLGATDLANAVAQCKTDFNIQ